VFLNMVIVNIYINCTSETLK